MKLFKTISLTLTALIILVLVTSAIKLNFIDQSYVNAPIVYVSETGEKIEAHYKADDSVEVHFIHSGNRVLKSFHAKRVRSASGAKFETKDRGFIFWTKGNEASLFNKETEIIYVGHEVN